MMQQMGFRFADELIIDSFAGGGGASTGIEWAFGRPVDIAINHSPSAIRMHEINHPHTKHYCESVWDVDPIKATRRQPVALAWFSPDCTHFSKAKGGKPVKKEIRGLAWVVLRWAAKVKPRIICLENVEEFETWGPLTRKRGRDKHPRPCKFRVGTTFDRWWSQLEALGYKIEMKKLKACDYGAPTTRERLFIIARRDSQSIVWPEPTHGPGRLKPYRTAAECIDFSIPCPSIFLTKEEVKQLGLKIRRPLAESTMRRIAKGVQRYVIDAAKPFIVSYYGNKGKNDFRGLGLNEPLKTQTTENRFSFVAPSLIPIDHTGSGHVPANDIQEPLRTIVTENRHALVSAFLAQHNTGVVGHQVTEPVSTITASGSQQNLVTSHMMKLRGNASERDSSQPTETPIPTITANGLHVAEVRAFLLKYYGVDQDPRLEYPLHTVTSKDRFGLVTVHGDLYQIADIGMRMLEPRELYRAQGFPDSYIINPEFNGKPLSKADQVRMVGNSVSPYVSMAIVKANAGIDAKEQAA